MRRSSLQIGGSDHVWFNVGTGAITWRRVPRGASVPAQRSQDRIGVYALMS
jgi:hypothetical protein